MDSSQILVVEDDSTFADIVQFQLSTVGFSSHNILSVQSLSEAREAEVEFVPEVILLDLNILDSNGISTYDSIVSIFPNASIIVLSGMDDRFLALQIVSKGAQDYILKSDIKPDLLEKTIKYGVLRRKLKEELELSEKKYKDVFYKSPMPMFKLRGTSLEITMANKASEELYDVASGELNGLSFYEFNSIGNTPFEELETISSHKKQFIQETFQGKELIVDVILNKLESSDDLEVISQAEEGEKKKIARELHDGLGQNMVLLNLLFQSLNPNSEQVGQYQEISSLLQSCIRELKEIAYSLLPPELENGFLNALDRFSNRINTLGKLNFIVAKEDGFTEADFGNIDKFNLYRIIQEFVNNSMKHAHAKNLIVELKRSEKEVLIKVSDDGVGFDNVKVIKGLGIQNIRHRMKMANIDGEIQSSPGNGVTLTMTLKKLTYF